jgi:hypothetical protein
LSLAIYPSLALFATQSPFFYDELSADFRGQARQQKKISIKTMQRKQKSPALLSQQFFIRQKPIRTCVFF